MNISETATTDLILTADAVVFADVDRVLHVLLVERRWDPYAGCWALPGGHRDPGDRTLKHTAGRELGEETGIRVQPSWLRPVGFYDEPGRDPRGRYATSAYWTVLPDLVEPTAADDAKRAAWVPVAQVLWTGVGGSVQLAFDHDEIVEDAAARFRAMRRDGR